MKAIEIEPVFWRHCLYNNAAIEIRGSATQLSEAQWDATMGANVKGSWMCSKYAIA